MVLGFSLFDQKSQTIDLAQSILNKVLQQTTNDCVVSCKNVNSDDINIVDTTIDGSLDIDQTCEIVGSSCVMKTLLDNTIINSISSDLSQEESSSAGFLNFSAGGSTSADVNVNVAVRNLASQIVDNNCKESSENDSYEVINIIGSTIKGDFKLDQSSSVSQSDCIINNLLKNFDNTDVKTKVSQKMDSSHLLWIIIIVVIVVIIIIIILYYYYSKKKTTNNTSSKTPNEQIIINTNFDENGNSIPRKKIISPIKNNNLLNTTNSSNTNSNNLNTNSSNLNTNSSNLNTNSNNLNTNSSNLNTNNLNRNISTNYTNPNFNTNRNNNLNNNLNNNSLNETSF
jgi:flagellar basal body-associated protein FliL